MSKAWLSVTRNQESIRGGTKNSLCKNLSVGKRLEFGTPSRLEFGTPSRSDGVKKDLKTGESGELGNFQKLAALPT